jgi:GNAT superfamily N-acetyltransferase
MATPGEFDRIRAFQQALDEAVVDRVEPWEFGTALLSPSITRVWDANYCRLDLPGGDADAIAAAATAVCQAAGLGHVSIVVPLEDEAERLGGELTGRGFEKVSHVSMVLRGSPPAPVVEVREASLEEMQAANPRLRSDEDPDPPEVEAALTEMTRRMDRARDGRWFAATGPEGEIEARAWLLRDDRVAQVEDVATAPAARGRGLAKAVVSAAALAALGSGAEVVFVVADAGETTPALYLKLGFEPLGITTRFVRKPAG